MRNGKQEEPLFPPWAINYLVKLGPLVALVLMYYLLSFVFHVPAKILLPVMGALVMFALIYFGGRLYKPFYADRDGRCTASGARQRTGCRHYIAGARLGGGCGRLRENGRCRYVR